ncbi:MAG: transcriptional regulator [Roseiflexaceae bacterium]|nr:transcriptional regulator [Roseiflexaceae bacterium]
MFPPTQIEQLLAQPPGPRLAFVRAKFRAEELAQTLVALANSQGGTVIIGATGRGKSAEGLASVEAAHGLALEAAMLCTPPLVLPLPEMVRAGPSSLLIVGVPSGLPHVYSLHGKYLRRTADADEPIPPDALRRLLLDRGETSWERLAPDAAQLSDLDSGKLNTYARRIGPAAESDVAAWLFRRGALAKKAEGWGLTAEPGDVEPSALSPQPSALRPTNAGLLLFAHEVDRFFPQCELTLVRYRGREMGDEFIREDIRDTLPEAVRRAEIWLSEHMRRGSRMIGLERQDWTQFPLGAVREALVNAVAHRDYTVRGEGIRIALFGDRLECYSPGRLPGHVTLQNLIEERYSRNETLVQVLADFGLIERLGYGIDRMLRQMADAGLPAPEFRETAAGFLVTLRGHALEGGNEAGGVDTSEWRKQGLSERQIAAMLHVAEHHRLTSGDMQELAPDVSAETLRRDLADLVDRKLLMKVGEKRGTYYIPR